MNSRGFFLQSIDEEYTWHPFDLPGTSNILLKKARGTYLFDASNKKYIDAVSSWWVNVHGHGNQQLANALQKQFRKIDHAMFAGFTHEPGAMLAKKLIEKTGIGKGRVFYSDNGSTSVEVALKLALHYFSQKGKNNIAIIGLENAYHGDTFGAMAASERSIFNRPFEDHMFKVYRLPVPEEKRINQIKKQIEEIESTHDGIVFIYEPLVQGAGGMIIYEANALRNILESFHQKETILIADEVMTGFYRTGTFLASHNESLNGILPDLICLSKGITGGVMPLGVTVVNDKIANAFKDKPKSEWFYHGHSYTGNPLACAVALKSLTLFNKAKLEQVKMIAEAHREFAASVTNHHILHKIKTCGTILRFEVKTQEQTGYTNTLRDKIYNYFLQNGIVIRPLGNIVYIMPPYCITRKDLEYIYRKIKALDLQQLAEREGKFGM